MQNRRNSLLIQREKIMTSLKCNRLWMKKNSFEIENAQKYHKISIAIRCSTSFPSRAHIWSTYCRYLSLFAASIELLKIFNAPKIRSEIQLEISIAIARSKSQKIHLKKELPSIHSRLVWTQSFVTKLSKLWQIPVETRRVFGSFSFKI